MALDGVIAIEVDSDSVIQRISARRTCLSCGSVTNLNVEGCAEPDCKCRTCGGELVQRDDDNETVVRKRLIDYKNVTAPLLKYYGDRGLLHTIDGEGTVDAVGMRIADVLDDIDKARTKQPEEEHEYIEPHD